MNQIHFPKKKKDIPNILTLPLKCTGQKNCNEYARHKTRTKTIDSQIFQNKKAKASINFLQDDKENEQGIFLNKTKRKPKGKYLRQCPEIELVHNRPHRRKKISILRNGVCQGPVSIDRRLEQVKNTCPFD